MRRILIALLALVGVGAAGLLHALNDRPEPGRYARVRDTGGGIGAVRVTHLGVSTLLISDGETSLMTDGFFTRPSLGAMLLGRIAPDRDRIARSLARAGGAELAAVIVVHSHYDHAMDAAEVARRTGALLVGSPSTANVGRGDGLGEDRLRIVRSVETMRFGAFSVTLIPSRHFPHGMAMGEIEEPLVPPARATDYREGGSYSVLVEHPSGSLLVQGSAGWIDGALAGRRADVVLLGVGGLGTKDEAYREAYWREVVEAVGPNVVIPIHWDDFTRPLDEPLRPLPRLLDDFTGTMDFLAARAAAAGMQFGLLRAWEPVSLFANPRP